MKCDQPVREGESTARLHGKIKNVLGSEGYVAGRSSISVSSVLCGGRKMALEQRH